MPLELVTIPCLADNYAFLLHDDATGATLLADAPEAWPIRDALEQRGWRLTHVVLTHHHHDHIDGLAELRETHAPQVIGAAADAHRLPPLDLAVKGGDRFDFAGHAVTVLDAAGHTTGHLAYHVADAGAVFTGDCLMALGCGRLFEGTAAQMWASLTRLAVLPDETLVCSGHEYTTSNARFALAIEPDNAALIRRAKDAEAARKANRPTVPSSLALEKATNPFLRAGLPEVKTGLGMAGAGDTETFAEIRSRKDHF